MLNTKLPKPSAQDSKAITQLRPSFQSSKGEVMSFVNRVGGSQVGCLRAASTYWGGRQGQKVWVSFPFSSEPLLHSILHFWRAPVHFCTLEIQLKALKRKTRCRNIRSCWTIPHRARLHLKVMYGAVQWMEQNNTPSSPPRVPTSSRPASTTTRKHIEGRGWSRWGGGDDGREG